MSENTNIIHTGKVMKFETLTTELHQAESHQLFYLEAVPLYLCFHSNLLEGYVLTK